MLQGSDLGEPCRNGTYGQTDNLASAEECTPCDPGSYCDGVALTGDTCDYLVPRKKKHVFSPQLEGTFGNINVFDSLFQFPLVHAQPGITAPKDKVRIHQLITCVLLDISVKLVQSIRRVVWMELTSQMKDKSNVLNVLKVTLRHSCMFFEK